MAEWSQMCAYTEANVRKYAPTKAGVYRLNYKKDEKYHVFYVGQSDDLQRRLLEHLGTSEPNACIKRHLRDYTCVFQFVEVSTQSDRDRIEKEEIEKYDPPCNRSS